MLRKLLLLSSVTLTLVGSSFGDDFYRITQRHTLVTHYRGDMVTFIDLNAHSVQSKVRAFYRQIKALGALTELQPGDVIRVSNYNEDGTARLVFGNDFGYIAKEDLTQKLN
jgi:hypothetical protein